MLKQFNHNMTLRSKIDSMELKRMEQAQNDIDDYQFLCGEHWQCRASYQNWVSIYDKKCKHCQRPNPYCEDYPRPLNEF